MERLIVHNGTAYAIACYYTDNVSPFGEYSLYVVVVIVWCPTVAVSLFGFLLRSSVLEEGPTRKSFCLAGIRNEVSTYTTRNRLEPLRDEIERIEELLLGSVTLHLLAHSRCDVLVVA
jgi:hypothetical protein